MVATATVGLPNVLDLMESEKSNAGVVQSHRWVSQLCGGAVLAFGMLASVGWVLEILGFNGRSGGWLLAHPCVAGGCALLGASLWLQRGKPRSPHQAACGRVCAVAAVALGVVAIAAAGAGVILENGPKVVHEMRGLAESFGSLPLHAAVVIILLGTALLMLDRGLSRWVLSLGLTTGMMVYLAVLAQWVSVASHTAFLLLSVGVVAAADDVGLMALIRNRVAWVFVSRMLPAVLLGPLIGSGFQVWGESLGLRVPVVDVELQLVLYAMILVMLMAWSADTVRRSDELAAEANAEAERERYRLGEMMDHVPDRIYFKDLDGRFLRNNRAHLARFGLVDAAQALGKTDFDFFPKAHAERAREDDLRVMCGGAPLAMEERIDWPDGRVEWASIIKLPLRDPSGKVIGLFGISHDISKRKRVEEELELMSDRLLLATRAASIGIWDYNPLHDSLVWDDQMFKIFGVDPKCFSGNLDSWRSTVHPDDLKLETDKVLRTLEGGPEYDSDFRIVWPDGSVHHIKANALVQRDDAGRAVHMVGTNWDITQQKRMEEELARSNADLAQFASIASHDLQEPLRAVAGCVELLVKGYRERLDNDALELMQHALEGTRRMQSLIRDLLAYARVDSSGRPLVSTDANAALDEALANLTVTLGEHQAVVTRGPLPTVVADARQLTQMFQNLIANGVKFCGGKRPEIHVSAEFQNGCWQFAVRDNGIGIEPQYLERIFEIFQRLHTRREYPGTGIGLAICKRIVERHRGRIWVESKPDEGSTFFFTLAESPNHAP